MIHRSMIRPSMTRRNMIRQSMTRPSTIPPSTVDAGLRRSIALGAACLQLVSLARCAPRPPTETPGPATGAAASAAPPSAPAATPTTAPSAAGVPAVSAPVAPPPPQAPPGGAPAPCAPALFCDDFEDDTVGAPPAAPWRDETGTSGATVRIDREHAHSGRNAVHVHAPKGASYRRGYFAIHQPPVFPAASQEMFGRAMVWLDQAPIPRPGQSDVHWTLFQGEGRSKDDRFNSIYRYGGQHQGLGLMANFETTPPVKSDCRQRSATRLPVAEWACVEWHFVVATNEMEFWLNGTELADLHVRERAGAPASGCQSTADLGGQWLAPPAFQSLYFGWERYSDPANDQNVWFDDIAISKTRVGCPE
jgi:hypothetical protein